ncbi:hypothetical protein FNF29_06116 [Cafeteria roenbergensis]|uniref:Peptidase M14 domain-containing protein n=1 Tax=Cafeteria roenbergensis TaxID=33653 RepID=A0A5A8C9E7_CAFRO|nr:hypothetical protein FNF29_06116 [Cafeteria roenbergensis]|eukprot:KAA0149229.1 hypothetical protein FNF29_06116 [Cafeteria roenbergensis]
MRLAGGAAAVGILAAGALFLLPLSVAVRSAPEPGVGPALPINSVRGNPDLADAVVFLEGLVVAYPELAAGPFHLARTEGKDRQHNVMAFCLGQCPAAAPVEGLGNGASLTRDDVPDVASVESLSGATASRSAGLEVLVDGMHHAREAPGLRMVVEVASQLAAGWAAGHPDVQSLLATRAVWLVPCLNPDSYVINVASVIKANGIVEPSTVVPALEGAMLRKNQHFYDSQSKCHTTGDSASYGVDLNRNYPVGWDAPDEFDGNVCDESYHGPSPASERETQGIQALVAARNFSVALNLHTFGKSINTPYAMSADNNGGGTLPRFAEGSTRRLVDALAAGMAGALQVEEEEPWEWGPAVQMVGYAAPGEAGDWMLDAHGVAAFAPELGPRFVRPAEPCVIGGGFQGRDVYAPCFWPEPHAVDRVMSDGVPLVWFALHAAAPLLDLQHAAETAVTVAWSGGATGEPGEAGACTAAVLPLQLVNAGARAARGTVHVVWATGEAASLAAASATDPADPAVGGSGSVASQQQPAAFRSQHRWPWQW